MENDKKIISLQTRTAVDPDDFKSDDAVQRFLLRSMQMCRDTKVKTIVILTIDENDHADHGFIAATEHHQALACLVIEDVRDDLKYSIFGGEEDDKES